MGINVVTYRKGGNPEAVKAAARKLKAFAEKHGAQQFVINSVVAGPDAGQWALILEQTPKTLNRCLTRRGAA